MDGGVRPGEGVECVRVLRFDGREWRLFSRTDGLPIHSWIDAMAVDSTGTVWGKPVYDDDYLAWVDPEDAFLPFPGFV